MKILIATEVYKPVVNGVVTSVCILEESLKKLGHDVRIMCPSSDRHNSIEGNVYRIGSSGGEHFCHGARLATNPSRKAVKPIIDWHPDVVHSQTEFFTFVLAKYVAWECGVPVIQTYHTLYEDYTHYFSPSAAVGRKVAVFFSKAILKNVSGVIVPSEKIRERLMRYKVSTTMRVIPTGLDFSKFSEPSPTAREEIREELDIPKEARIIMTVGRVVREKNMPELLEYFKRYTEEGRWPEKIVFILAGDGAYLENLKKEAGELGIEDLVRFTGLVPQDRIADHYAAGEVFLSASTSETQGLTYYEAMAAGTPVLCRDDPCLAPILTTGSNGFTYTDYETFADHLTDLLGDPDLCARMVEEGKKRVAEFSGEKFASRVLEFYQEIQREYYAEHPRRLPKDAGLAN